MALMPTRRRPLVYLASRYSRRAEMIEKAATLRGLNLADVDCRWLKEPHDWTGEADTPEGLEQAQRFALDDLADLGRAHAVVVFTEEPARVREAALAELDDYVPGHTSHERAAERIAAAAGGYRRGGSLVELGMAIGMGKHTIVVGPAANVFCTLPVVRRYDAWEMAVAHLVQWRAAAEAQALRGQLVARP
jgi:hypothetical protein